MSRSLKVHPDFISQVKLAVKRAGYPRQKDLADELQMSLATISNYLNGRPVDNLNFQEISERLAQEWKEIADFQHENENNSSLNGKAQSDTVITFNQSENDEEFIYVERHPIEKSCYQELLKPGALVRIKAPKLMGKTALIMEMSRRLTQQGYRSVYVNLHLAHQEDFSNLNQFLKWFCVGVGQSLGLPNKLADYWDEKFSTSKVDCTHYFEKHLLAKINCPLVLCLDEVDRIFPHQQVASEFLGLLRAWHEQAKIRPVWRQLRLVVSHSTEVYIPLNINESPFNVGLPIELPEFTPEQVKSLVQKHQLDWDSFQVKKLLDLVGGHPYLLEQAFSYCKTNGKKSLDNILETAPTEAGIYRNHLRHLRRLIQQHEDLVSGLKKVFIATENVRLPSNQAYKLHSMGLVNLKGNEVSPSRSLYQQYFRECFGN